VAGYTVINPRGKTCLRVFCYGIMLTALIAYYFSGSRPLEKSNAVTFHWK